MHHSFSVRVELDRLPGGRIALLVIAAILVILLCLGVVLLIGLPDRFVVTTLKGEAPREIARVEQTLIETDTTTERDARQARERLSSYEWVDQQAGIVRIPVERAFELVQQEAR